MCGVAAIISLSRSPLPAPARACAVMNALQQHRGPDGEGTWVHPEGFVAFGHRRLSIIDIDTGQQPMHDGGGNVITYNGQAYNYRELAGRLHDTVMTTKSDTEVVLHAYRRWGADCVHELRGMFAFALWDEARQTLFCARDRLGIKPLYYTIVDHVLYLASEIKALVPFLPAVETDLDAFNDYLRFQFCLKGRTLFKGVHELRPGHRMTVRNADVAISRYWALPETQDLVGQARDHEDGIRAALAESVTLHLRSDVPVGAYVSGGLDSSIVASLAADGGGAPGLIGFAGKFSAHPDCDESGYARDLAGDRRFPLHEVDISSGDFVDTIQQVVYHLDVPVAGIGSFPQYMVSRAASRHRKVLLGGQGADELFGGYVRYLVASNAGSSERVLQGVGDYAALVKRHDPSVADAAERYFRLIDRSNGLDAEIRSRSLDRQAPFDDFQQIFRANGDGLNALDLMHRFDLQTVLPALLHVEDRVSMAHGLESRVPFLDHPLVEFATRIPSAIKMKDGNLKHLLRQAMRHTLPESIAQRTTKMGFPVPFHDWLRAPGVVRDFVIDVLSSEPARTRSLIDNRAVVARLDAEPRFGRAIWGFLCLELWQRAFHDESSRFRRLVTGSGQV
jgi:asparagine synthase (glutamine-hydrolysing)